ncbi:hypothetical protein BABINDRAFT_177659 [Babjeviella inositovora NRRL Y-12698]|uniref:Transcription activator GCR1-like domain-containing protein n=1 Tax=Babjeviella inositovora NRRL Y-12698 TaxID=984486 RepID=A0A1E3QK58_9ASCO|nr:uncharacterized protein BABINDRAFT_177659 [Babjeviella inositovora NRRL Y-12698]ODQ78073.1 hypothetical protein BABINDRAFT_177659 [Babjeviella inositovora NRRL Y-12698]
MFSTTPIRYLPPAPPRRIASGYLSLTPDSLVGDRFSMTHLNPSSPTELKGPTDAGLLERLEGTVDAMSKEIERLHQDIHRLRSKYRAMQVESKPQPRPLARSNAYTQTGPDTLTKPAIGLPKHMRQALVQAEYPDGHGFRFANAPESIEEIYTEFCERRNNIPCPLELERRYGEVWRGRSAYTLSKTYGRRKIVYDTVENGIRNGLTRDGSIKMLQRFLDTNKISLSVCMNSKTVKLPEVFKKHQST